MSTSVQSLQLLQHDHTDTCVLLAGQPELACELEAFLEPGPDQYWGMVWTAAAVTLFFSAAWLAKSQWFRLSSGGLMGVTGALVIVLLVIIRWVAPASSRGSSSAAQAPRCALALHHMTSCCVQGEAGMFPHGNCAQREATAPSPKKAALLQPSISRPHLLLLTCMRAGTRLQSAPLVLALR